MLAEKLLHKIYFLWETYMRKTDFRRVAVFVCAAIMLVFPASVFAQKTKISKGNAAPDFSVKMTDGAEISLSDLRGKPVLLHFWATWCPPCVRELPHIAGIAADRSDDIAVLAISVGETKETVREYIDSKDGDFASFVSGYDDDGAVSRLYNVTAIPYTIFISPDGIITEVQTGAYTPDRLKISVDKAVRNAR